MRDAKFLPIVALLQGIYYLLTGIWPILSRSTFEKVTGPKVDFWLVRTTGALITATGAALTVAGLRGEVTAETAVLGIGSAASLGSSDAIYSSHGRISIAYLLESFVEFALVIVWAVGLLTGSRRGSMLQLMPKHGRSHRI